MKEGKKLAMLLKLAWQIKPLYILLLILNALVNAGKLIINIVLPRYLIDNLLDFVNGTGSTDSIFIWVGALVASNLLFAFLAKTFTRVMAHNNLYMSEQLNRKLSEKIMNIDYQHLENPYYLDLKARAAFAIQNQNALGNLVNGVADFVKNLVTVLGLVVIMFRLSWLLVVIMMLTVFIIILIQASFAKYQVTFYQGLIPVNRRFGYYIDAAYDNKMQKEYRLYGMSQIMGDRIFEYNTSINKWIGKLYRKQGIMMGLFNVMTVLQTALAYGYVGLRCISEYLGTKISIGELTMYVNAAINFGTSSLALGMDMVAVSQMLSYLDPFAELLDLPNEKDSGGTARLDCPVKSVRFEKVSFSYPKSDKLVLNNISFEIKQGEKVSIVGLNGAGKTTLIKLLCRLYRPNEGAIYVNDININDYDYSDYLKNISAVFQDYKLFDFSIEENVSCEGLGENSEGAYEVIDKVGMKEKVDSLPNGMSSLIGKTYDKDGIELSGGQSQKIVIARALYKNANLIILDEPTSALDPLSEAEIYEQFNSLVGEKTAIYISHRMSSSVFCDRVLIIDNGKVADYDTHKNLMKKTDSLYYKMFNAQAVNYKIND